MPHICLITEGLNSFGQKGGVATWIKELITSLPEYSFSWINFSSTRVKPIQTEKIANLITSESIYISSYPLAIDKLSEKWRRIRLPACDLYHATSTGCASLLGISLSQKNKIPLLLTEHAVYWKELQDTHELECGLRLPEDYTVSFRAIASSAYQQASYITSPVTYVQSIQIQEGADPDKCLVVPNGLTPLSNSRKKLNRPFCLGFVGRITRIKNLELWIEIAAEIHQINSSVQFKLIGPLEDKHYGVLLHQLIKEKNLTGHISFLPAIDYDEWREELDALLLTSHMESQPYVILEAFSSGIPVFARSVGGIPETIGSAGYLFDVEENPTKIADDILSILRSSSTMEEYRTKAWIFFQNRYHIAYMKKEMERIYQLGLRKYDKR
jgi:glycosyltransferase involved in cell wall biosynthesis